MVAQADGANWTKVPGYDIAGEGDVHVIGDYPSKFSLAAMKDLVVQKGWSAFSLGKNGT